MNKCIYIVADQDRVPVYVGWGTVTRPGEHWSAGHRRSYPTKLLYRWFEEGGPAWFWIVETPGSADVERQWINSIGTVENRTGPLLNVDTRRRAGIARSGLADIDGRILLERRPALAVNCRPVPELECKPDGPGPRCRLAFPTKLLRPVHGVL